MKTKHIVCLVLLVVARLFAAAPTTAVSVTVDRTTATYRPGEMVTFRVGVPAGQKAQYQLSKDGWGDLGSGDVDGGVVKGSLDEPGILRCEVTCAGATVYGGAAVEPEKITPSLPAPEDFDVFWEKQKDRLAYEAAKAVLTPVKSPNAAIECFDVQINCPGGAPVSGYLAIPKEAKAKSLGAILYPHSAGVRDSDLPHAVKGAKMGLIAFDFNAHGLPNGRPKKFYDDVSEGALKGYPGFNSDDREKIYFVGMYLRLLRALDFLTTRPEWDVKSLIVEGSSQGGGQAIVAAGLDHRVTLCLANVPALCDHTGFVVRRTSGWPRIVPKDGSGKYSEKATQAARYIDAMNFAARIKCPTYVNVGLIDRTSPATSVYAMYNNIPATTEKHIIARVMPHSFPPDLIARFDEIIKAHLGRE